MGVQIALLKRDDGVRRQWLGHLRDRLIIVFERTIRERRQLAGGARRHEANIVFPELKSAGQTLERGLDGGPGRLDLVVVPRERKRHAAQQIQRYADDEVGLTGLDLDKRIHHPVERQIVGIRRGKPRAVQNSHTAAQQIQRFNIGNSFDTSGSGQEAPLLGRWRQGSGASSGWT